MLHILPWSVGVVDKIGSGRRSSHVEDFSLGVLGPPQLARSQPRRGVSMTALVVGQWWYRGRGHSPGAAIYARTIAHDLAENRSICRHFREEAA